MQSDRAFPRLNVVQVVSGVWKNWQRRRARLAELDNSEPAEMQHMARDLGTSVSELRILAGHDEDAADLVQRRLRGLNIDPAKIEPAVMRHELEDHPKAARWPKYWPNEQTIDALVAEKKL